jgi:hypothetical protein
MTRQSSITIHQDSAGDYEVEIFDCSQPKRVIICAHGDGVRRWDGENFFYAVAEHYTDSVVMLVDQNQSSDEGVVSNPLPILVLRVQKLIATAKKNYSDIPIVVLGHSMGCGVISQLDLASVKGVVFVAPADGWRGAKLIKRHGPDIIHGRTVTSRDGRKKVITAEYFESVRNIIWEDEYRKLLNRFQPVYVFEAGQDEILGEEHHMHHELPFTKYQVIAEGKHNFAGQPLQELFNEMDVLV